MLHHQRQRVARRSTLHLRSKRLTIAFTLNQHLAGRPLPLELHASLQNLLKSELQHCIVTADPSNWQEAPFWKSWQRLLPALGQVFSSADIQVEDQRLYSTIPGIISELERSTHIATSNPLAYEHWVTQFNHYLMQAIQKQVLECAPLPNLAYPEGYAPSTTRVTPALLRQSEAIQQGDWLEFSGAENERVRCKLALKNPAADQLLFVDRTGRKVLVKSNKDFALCLSSGIAKPLRIRPAAQILTEFHHSLAKQAQAETAKTLALTMEKAARALKALEAQQKAQASAAEQARQASQRQMEQQLEARRAAARKAMAEARALAELEEQKAQARAAEAQARLEQQAQAQAQAADAQLSAAQQAVKELHVGAWLELSTNDRDWVRTKLSVIISATGKYIFVDQLGRKFAEFQQEHIIELVAAERARIIHKGDNFEDQLAKVIRGLRKDISP